MKTGITKLVPRLVLSGEEKYVLKMKHFKTIPSNQVSTQTGAFMLGIEITIMIQGLSILTLPQ